MKKSKKSINIDKKSIIKKKIKKEKQKKSIIKKNYIITFKYLALFIFSLFIIIIEKYKNYFSSSFKETEANIIVENHYESFENMKQRYSKFSLLAPYLEQVTLLNHVHDKKYKRNKKNKGNVHICVSLNNRYVYSILVSIETVLFNCNKAKTFFTYHILCTPDVNEESLTILKSLIYQYPSNLELIFYNMGNTFLSHNNDRISQATYYRILSPVMFDIDRIIYLDGDTLTLKDLQEMYNIELNDNYVLGILDFFTYGIDYLGIKSEKYINAGVIILNLRKIREDNKIFDLINVINKKMELRTQDQTLINYIFYPKIGILPSKYTIFNHLDESDAKFYFNLLRTKINYTELINAINDPTIIHTSICWPKMWSTKAKMQDSFSACKQRNNCSCEKFHNLWYYYANKTKYYKEILKINGKSE